VIDLQAKCGCKEEVVILSSAGEGVALDLTGLMEAYFNDKGAHVYECGMDFKASICDHLADCLHIDQ
jgi:hypothetical protein